MMYMLLVHRRHTMQHHVHQEDGSREQFEAVFQVPNNAVAS